MRKLFQAEERANATHIRAFRGIGLLLQHTTNWYCRPPMNATKEDDEVFHVPFWLPHAHSISGVIETEGADGWHQPWCLIDSVFGMCGTQTSRPLSAFRPTELKQAADASALPGGKNKRNRLACRRSGSCVCGIARRQESGCLAGTTVSSTAWELTPS